MFTPWFCIYKRSETGAEEASSSSGLRHLSRKENALQSWREKQLLELTQARLKVKVDNKQLLFQNNLNELMQPSKTSKWIRDVQTKNNLREISTHGLRHTHCTLLFESGFFTPAQVMERMGHTDIETPLKIYTHVTRQSLANSMKNYLNFIKSDSAE